MLNKKDRWPIEPGQDKFTFKDLDGNEIVTTDPLVVTSTMWTKFWPVPPIGTLAKLFKSMPQGEEILLEDCGVLIRKHFRIV